MNPGYAERLMLSSAETLIPSSNKLELSPNPTWRYGKIKVSMASGVMGL
jgi:hypothetical protein